MVKLRTKFDTTDFSFACINKMNLNKVKLIDPLNDPRWDEFVDNHPYGTIYHHSSWMKVIATTYKQVKPLCLILEKDNQCIHAAIPCFIVKSKLTGTRFVSLPFTSYCDPLVVEEEGLIKLLDEIIHILENISALYLELRVFRNKNLIKDRRFKCHNYHKIHILDVKDGFEKIKRTFPKDIVYSKKRAIKSGVIIKEVMSKQDLKRFYYIHAVTRKRQGFPIQPYKFFKNMWEIMYPQGYFTLLLAELNRKAIAGKLLFKYKDTVSCEIQASIRKYLPIRPNHLLLWRAIEMACSGGYIYFDFGKTPPENKGLLNFKERWGAKMYDLPYFYYPEIKGMMSLEQNDLRHRLLRSSLRNMPLPIAKILGKIVYHHLG